nr:unnamed protein product [Callosobruchus chinensis]
MGNLPEERVVPSSPFTISGVDYAGPFWIKERKGRCSRHSKRSKWKVTKLNLQVGDLVVIMDDGASPTEWRRGRIVGLTKGSDGIPRVANIRTSTGVVSRNFTKLCVLPVKQSVTSEVHC